ncbi:MAG: DUF3604 domain-containing protein [Rhizomicrobium sp.]
MTCQARFFASASIVALCAASTALAQGSDPAKRQAWFGDLHLHTSFSFDAWALMGTKITPDEAYRFAKGETIPYLGKQVHREDPPLDFLAITDHSEYMGVMRQLDDPNSAFAQTEVGKKIKASPITGFISIFRNTSGSRQIGDFDSTPVMHDAWQREIDAANSNYQPGKFTTFIAYEWTSMPKGRYNLHRNVIFSGDHAPYPFTSRDSQRPDDLWSYLEKNRAEGEDVIAIPHNANASGGLMFDWVNSDGKPIDENYATRRITNEPVTEIYQNKGGSETIPVLSSADEFSNFEVMDNLLLGSVKSDPNGSYVRQAEGRGLVIQQKVGVNPYKLGFVGASDFHNGLSTAAENAFAGFVFGVDPNVTVPDAEAAKKMLTPQPALRLDDPDAAEASNIPTPVIPDIPFNPGKFTDPTTFGSAGLTGAWAENNTRESIFAAFRRKETFATSGTRMRIRFFGGWGYDAGLTKQKDWVAKAYEKGVPMGADLPAASAKHAPSFAVWAVKDPNGANLDRVQIIKLWTEGDGFKEKVFDVALSGGRKVDPKTGHAVPVGNTVDLNTATYKNTIGATELSATWKDPEFDPSKPAVYYARALEIPTPRWTTILAVKDHLPIPNNGRAILQERAWASPIWFTPQTKSARAARKGNPA